MFPTEIIKKKRNKQELSSEEIEFFINSYTKDQLPDYQMSALLMAIVLNGMTDRETLDLTKIMLESGDRVRFDDSFFSVDKHSTGGVGDKTSLILAPIVAACGVPVPMMSGRGLGHTGGTLDKLESIPGFTTALSLNDFKKMVEDVGLSFIGQTKNICPADKKIYALRDVTATVESLPLICASIMSKKIAEGIKGLVLDVKLGTGAFMKNIDDAKALANGLVTIGRNYGLETQALITDMNQPLGRFVGNALEVSECISILKRENFNDYNYTDFSDTEELSLQLSAHMVSIGKKIHHDQALNECKEVLENGKAYEKFAQVCEKQSGKLNQLPAPSVKTDVLSDRDGFLVEMNTELIGLSSIALGAGRKQLTDKINPVSGLGLHKKLGSPVKKGERLFTLYTDNDQKGIDEAMMLLKKAYRIDTHQIPTNDLILQKI